MSDAGYHLLVVDDTQDNRDVLSARLERLGHRVTCAESGRAALDLLEAENFDLILLDIMMPEMDGWEVLRIIKKDAQWRDVPVLMVTALKDADNVVKCIELGAEDYLEKPINVKLLQARVTACLSKKRAREQEQSFRRSVEAERKRADDLLYDLFPHSIVEELKATKTVKPQRYQRVAVLFCDIVGFTSYCDEREPEEVIQHLQTLFEKFEEIVERHGMEKIKTIGDCFMATSGLLRRVENPVLKCVQGGVDMIEAVQQCTPGWNVRIGIHVGPVVAGLAGRKQYSFDIWGDTVNTASRMESAGRAGSVVISAVAWQHVSDLCRGESLGVTEIKGLGPMEVFRFKHFLRH